MDGVNRDAAGCGVVMDMAAGIVAVSPGFEFVATVANQFVVDEAAGCISASAFAFDRAGTTEQ